MKAVTRMIVLSYRMIFPDNVIKEKIGLQFVAYFFLTALSCIYGISQARFYFGVNTKSWLIKNTDKARATSWTFNNIQ